LSIDSGQAVVLDDLLRGLPPALRVNSTEVRAAVKRSGRTVVVIDDDPTGTQTVTGVPLVTSWSVEDLRWALRQRAPAVCVLANTRSLEPHEAAQRVREIVRALKVASERESAGFVILSRGDSTLRGHFHAETAAIDAELQALGDPPIDGVVVCPAYIEAERVTIDDVHFAPTPAGIVPVAQTEFARDSSFGYRSSNLRHFVAEKSGQAIRHEDVESISLDDIRVGGVPRVTEKLASLRDGRVVVVNATCGDDLRVVSLAVIAAEERGKRFLLRTAPSFVGARAGLDPQAPLRGTQKIYGDDRAGTGGLVVVGSHVDLTTRQLARLRRLPNLAAFEIPVHEVLTGNVDQVLDSVAAQVSAELAERDAVVFTSRDVWAGADRLRVANVISRALVRLTRDVVAQRKPSFIVAKGGITSSDLATEALGIQRAWARGSLLPGQVALWQSIDGPAARMPFVVFPGNVGSDDALADVVTILREARECS
jgi:uncharacterized protein YgbK (DUF1537 family)